MRPPLLARAGLLCGVVAPLWWGGMIAYCASRFPGYTHTAHFISELAAREAPTAALMRNGGFLATGVLYGLFAAAAAWWLRARRLALPGVALIALAGFARIGAGVYACEPGCDPTILSSAQDWHYVYASAGYALMMLAALACGFALRGERGMQHLLAWGVGTTMWSAGFLFLMEHEAAWQGLHQRFASGLLSVWLLVFAVTLWRSGPPSLRPGITPIVTPPARAATAPRRRARRRR